MNWLHGLQANGPAIILAVIVLFLKYPQIVDFCFNRRKSKRDSTVDTYTDHILVRRERNTYVNHDDCHRAMDELKVMLGSHRDEIRAEIHDGNEILHQRIDKLFEIQAATR